ncbi:hypothetical protein HELRODRAFT_188674 [Helobdella robusta]|uniref:Glycosyltransferase family 92 protein n=1 Tax=Helobdella robusta TaxID=6412 RepID=T1FQ85_HELRO|nr:hypothetical protein HELRODRAFT_188674 [Helobdella robusta]ESO02360.1 hypothetical protein HELRODRAFT_188674 [Helobdella robusta]
MFLRRMLMKPAGELSLKEIFVCFFLLVLAFNILIYFTRYQSSQSLWSVKYGFNSQLTTQLTNPLSEEEKQALLNNNKLNPLANNLLPTTTPQYQTTTFQIEEKRRSRPIPPESPCKRPKHGRLRDDGRWFDFGARGMFLFAYTAFFDDRESLQSDPVIRVIAMSTIIENMAHQPNLICRFYYPLDQNGNLKSRDSEDDDESGSKHNHQDAFIDVQVEKNPIRKMGMGWQLNYKLVREYLFTCPLPTVEQLLELPNVNGSLIAEVEDLIPSWLTLLAGSEEAEKVASCMPIEVPEKPKVQKEFALCVQIGYGAIDPVHLVEWMELQKILGVDVIGFYDMEIDEPAMAVLKHYAEEGLVDLRRSDYIPNGPQQYMLHGSPVINDCMYRHMFTHRYLLVYDVDEVILPLKKTSTSQTLNNFSSLVQMIKEKHGNDPRLYLFRNHYFFTDLPPDQRELSEFTFLKYRQSVPVSVFGYSTKSLTDPQTCVVMHNHFCWSYTKKYETMKMLDVDMTLAVNQHYKKCHLPTSECTGLLKQASENKAIVPYRDELITNVHRTVTIIRQKVKDLENDDPFKGHFKEIVL